MYKKCSDNSFFQGLKFIKGTSVGTATINCENSGAYCYNMTASAASLIEVTKAGCSMWRCMVIFF